MNNPFETINARLTNIECLLLDLKHPSLPKNRANLGELNVLTIKQAAAFLSLSVPTLYGLVSRQSIPVSKQGKRLYFSQSELIDWVKTGRKLTLSEIDSQAGSNLGKRKGGKNA